MNSVFIDLLVASNWKRISESNKTHSTRLYRTEKLIPLSNDLRKHLHLYDYRQTNFKSFIMIPERLPTSNITSNSHENVDLHEYFFVLDYFDDFVNIPAAIVAIEIFGLAMEMQIHYMRSTWIMTQLRKECSKRFLKSFLTFSSFKAFIAFRLCNWVPNIVETKTKILKCLFAIIGLEILMILELINNTGCAYVEEWNQMHMKNYRVVEKQFGWGKEKDAELHSLRKFLAAVNFQFQPW